MVQYLHAIELIGLSEYCREERSSFAVAYSLFLSSYLEVMSRSSAFAASVR